MIDIGMQTRNIINKDLCKCLPRSCLSGDPVKACEQRVSKALANPTAIENPVTLQYIVANADAANSSVPTWPKENLKLRNLKLH